MKIGGGDVREYTLESLMEQISMGPSSTTSIRSAFRTVFSLCAIMMMKDERNICCALCSESGRLPEYGPEIHRFRNGRGDAEVDSYKVFPGIELNIY